MKTLLGLAGAGLAAGVLFLWAGSGATGTSPPDAGTLAEGRALYEANCAACHGAQLEGQPDWRTPLPSGRLPAPRHDASGHTRHHPDDLLVRIIREGTSAVVGGGYESDMPAFGDVLSDAEIEAVLDYIKSTWRERERAHQESLVP